MNKLFLYLGIFFLSLVNHAKATKLAWWDDAQNYMEKRSKGERWRLKIIQDCFTILSQRAAERIGDISAEKRSSCEFVPAKPPVFIFRLCKSRIKD